MTTPIETLECLEAEIGRFELKDLLTTLSTLVHDITYIPEKRKEDGLRKIVIAAPWIAVIAIIRSKRDNDLLLSKNISYLEDWALHIDTLFKNTKLHDGIIQDFKILPEKSIANELISDRTWEEKILPNLPATSHFRNENIETQSNYTTNSIIPIVRDHKYVQRFLKGIHNQKQRDSFKTDLEDNLGTINIHSIAVNLQKISSILYINRGHVSQKDLLDMLKDEQCNPSWCENDEKNSEKILTQINALLDFLSIEATQIPKKYEKMKEKLSQHKTLLINENPFWNNPLVKYTCDGGETLYICPSISILKIRLETIFIRIIDDWIKLIDAEKDKKKCESLRGSVCEDYIGERLKYHNNSNTNNPKPFIKSIANLDNKDEAKKYITLKEDEKYDQLSIADFIFETDKYIVILECKSTLGIWQAFYENRSNYHSSLDRMLKALKQCNQTRKRFKKREDDHRPFFSLVIANENIWIEGTIVGLILNEADTSKKEESNLNLNFGDYSIVSIPMFDYLLYTKNIDTFIDVCIEKAKTNVTSIEEAIKALNVAFVYKNLEENELAYFVEVFNKIVIADNSNIIN